MKFLLSQIILFFLYLILSTSLYADGIGAYFSGGGGEIIWNKTAVKRSKNYFIGGGLVYDTNLSKDKLFNYRLNIGYDRFSAKSKLKESNVDCIINRFSLMNTFGFGLIRTEYIRFWLGPQLGLKYAYEGYLKIRGNYGPLHEKEYFRLGEINGGLVFGLNYNISKYITVAIDLGFRYGLINRHGYMMDINYYKHIKYEDIEQHHNLEGFANIGVLYRFNESNAGENKL